MVLKMSIALLLGDIAISVLSVFLGYMIRLSHTSFSDGVAGLNILSVLPITTTVMFSSFLIELYDSERNAERKGLLIQISGATVISFLLLSTIFYMVPSISIGRGILMISLIISSLIQYLWHVSYKIFLHLPGFTKRVIVLGTGPLAHKMGKLIASTNHCILGGYVSCTSEAVNVPVSAILPNGCGLMETARNEKANKIVVSLSERRGIFPVKEVLDCKLGGIEVVDAQSFYEQMTGKILLENITPSDLIFSDGFKLTPFRQIQKRLFDIIFALIGLIISIPIIPLIALIVRIDSPGPIFFGQIRTGENEKKFKLFKFRTMRNDAEEKTGAVWAQKNDSRVTRIGNFLRKSRLDELPQLYNVLRGDMSFIGPRPERPEFIEKLNAIIAFYSERHVVKPGITGWAQIKYPYGASIEDAIEKLKYDLYYIKHTSLFLDLLIVIETIKVVIFARGGR